MKRSDIYKAILNDVFGRMRHNEIIDEDTYRDTIDYISNGEFCNIECDSVDIKYKAIVKEIVAWDGSNDIEINVGSRFYYEIAVGEQLDYYKEISVCSDNPKYALISASELYDNIDASDVNSFLQKIELIWAAINSSNEEKDRFWQICNNKECNAFYIITDEVLSSSEEKWNAYSYGYLLYANAKGYDRNLKLNYPKEKKFSTNLPYNKSNKYCQYYELFDLISESHYYDDILRRYLNMYQIIENMCYRRSLAKISHGAKRGFVRHSIAIASKANRNETDEMISGIADLFHGISSEIYANEINPYKVFLEKEYAIQGGGHSDKKIAKIIYSIRNSIVHNKSTELHFSFGNFDEYKDIIGLISLLIDKLEPKIIDIINSPSNTVLEYEGKKMNLY